MRCLVQAVVDLAALLAGAHQAGALSISRWCETVGRLRVTRVSDIADVELFAREQLHQVLAHRVGQRVEQVAAGRQVVAQLHDLGAEGLRIYQAARVRLIQYGDPLKHIDILACCLSMSSGVVRRSARCSCRRLGLHRLVRHDDILGDGLDRWPKNTNDAACDDGTQRLSHNKARHRRRRDTREACLTAFGRGSRPGWRSSSTT